MRLKSHYPVAIVGAGPTGLVLAQLLTRHGIAALLIDRGPATVNEARAVTIDDESLRTLQACGLIDKLLPDMVLGYGVHYYSWRQALFARIEPSSQEYGYPKRNAFRQQLLVAALADALCASPLVDLRFNHELVDFRSQRDGVELLIRTAGGDEWIRSDWLVGCDGGRSTVRERLGIEMEGSTYGERWLIADLVGRQDPFRHTRTYCDPTRPAIRLPGPQATVRYEFMLRPDEKAEHVLEEKVVRNWIRARESSDADITIARKVVYTFHARVASRWRSGRVVLAGDAAHLSPPFAGQGMNSGVRDAANLGWKLAVVVRDGASTTLLDTYEKERKPHAWALIRMALRIGAYMQPKSRLGAALAQGALRLVCLLPAARDYILHLKFKPKPRFKDGLFIPWRFGKPVVAPGQLMTQPKIQTFDRAERRLDDVLGDGFALLCWTGERSRETPPEAMSSALPGGLASNRYLPGTRTPVKCIEVLRAESDFLPEYRGRLLIRDATGELARVLDSAQAQAVLLRPDRYVLGYLSGETARDWQTVERALAAFYTAS